MMKVNQSKESKKKYVQDSVAIDLQRAWVSEKNEMIYLLDYKLLEDLHHILFNVVSPVRHAVHPSLKMSNNKYNNES